MPRPVNPEDRMLDEERDEQVSENRRRLKDTIERLPPKMRRCVLLYIYQGKKYREIAELLDVEINTVKSQIAQAKTRLRSLLDELADEQEYRS